jgi:hypothetical protein
MGFANYKVFGRPGEWHVEHDGKVDNTYETRWTIPMRQRSPRLRQLLQRRQMHCAKAMKS